MKYKHPIKTYGEITLYGTNYIFELDINTFATINIYNEGRLVGINDQRISFVTEGVDRNDNLRIYENDKLVLSQNIKDRENDFYDLTKDFYNYYTFIEEGSEEVKEILYSSINSYVVKWNLNSNYTCFFLFGDKFLLIRNEGVMVYSSQTTEKLWDYDLSKYFNREIPTYASGDPIYKISVEKIIYNPAFQSLILSITPNIKIALQAETGKLLWEAEGYPTSGAYYLLDEQTGHIHYFTREIVKGMERYRIHYHIINGETGEFLLSRDFTEDLQVPEDKVFDINPKPTLGAFKGDFLYFTMADLGRLYKMDKHTSKVVAIDEQEGIYYKSNPVIHQNRLFLIEDNDIQNLWVFEV